jgi:asparagine synthetase B (glutamine-hydrolysing)
MTGIRSSGLTARFKNRRRLVAEGQELKSTDGTAVILRASACTGRLGELAARHVHLRLLGASQRRLLLARDPLRIKPLYSRGRRNLTRAGRWPLPQSFVSS